MKATKIPINTLLLALITSHNANGLSIHQQPPKKTNTTPISRGTFLAAVATSVVFTPSILLSPPANAADVTIGGNLQYGGDDIMSPKDHGTARKPVQENLRYGVSRKIADKICCFNRHFAELGGYYKDTSFLEVVSNSPGPVTFYDSVTGSPLFVAPVGRSMDNFLQESAVHGWPSFRDEEVVWENVRVLKSSGETVSVDGTHLGHNLPDKKGNRYCINLVSVAGSPVV